MAYDNSQVLRFWQEIKERHYQEGLTAPSGTKCPYPPTSFAAIHWRRGASQRSQHGE